MCINGFMSVLRCVGKTYVNTQACSACLFRMCAAVGVPACHLSVCDLASLRQHLCLSGDRLHQPVCWN